MSGNLIGAGRQLVAVLRRHFLPSGNPPLGSRWQIDWPLERQADETAMREYSHQLLNLQFEIGEDDQTLYFGSLLTEGQHVARATENVPPLAEASVAIRELAGCLKIPDVNADRLRYLFDELCKRQWSHWIGIFARVENGIPQSIGLTYELHPLEARFLDDLEESITEAAAAIDDTAETWSPEQSPSEWAKLFGVSWKTLKRRIDAGELRAKKITAKSYRVHIADLPPESDHK